MIISENIRALARECDSELAGIYARIDDIATYNTEKVLDAFREERISERHFYPTTGYGYNDDGRDAADRLFARCLGCEAGFVSHNIISGTHAIAIGLYALLKPGDTMLSVTGTPYDTLQGVIGINGEEDSVISGGVAYKEIPLTSEGRLDIPAVLAGLENDRSIKMVYVQRSKGYATRPTFSVQQIGELIRFVKELKPGVICMVDNCYGEFTEIIEPSDVGADMIVGSLIKNPGGGLAPTGGYICGTQECVDQCAYRLTAPGLGAELGATLGLMQSFFQGFFLAPTVTAGALKGAVFAAHLYEGLGFSCVPRAGEERNDIIQAVSLGSEAAMVAFCKGIQAAAPVDSYVTPEPWAMPGYEDEVIMAAGAFIQGASIELSADGPIREPYAVYFQGGLTWYHAKLGILMSLQNMLDAGLIEL